MVCLHVDNWTAIIYLYFQIHTKICRNLISRFFFVLNMFIEFSLLIACKKINLNSKSKYLYHCIICVASKIAMKYIPNPFHDSFSLLFVFIFRKLNLMKRMENLGSSMQTMRIMLIEVFRFGICTRALYNRSIGSWLYISEYSIVVPANRGHKNNMLITYDIL